MSARAYKTGQHIAAAAATIGQHCDFPIDPVRCAAVAAAAAAPHVPCIIGTGLAPENEGLVAGQHSLLLVSGYIAATALLLLLLCYTPSLISSSHTHIHRRAEALLLVAGFPKSSLEPCHAQATHMGKL